MVKCALSPYSRQEVIVNIEAEMAYWRLHYSASPFNSSHRPFDAYIPTLKFGYDAYLCNYAKDLNSILPQLEQRYASLPLDPGQRLDWPVAEAVIQEAWKRMCPADRDDANLGAALLDRMAYHPSNTRSIATAL